MIPALQNADFVRYGVMHRNTFIDSPRILNADFSCRQDPALFFAGQLTGVEGYMESASSGLLAGINAARIALGQDGITLPRECMMGSLAAYISDDSIVDFQPGVLPPLAHHIRDKRERAAEYARRSFSLLSQTIQDAKI